MYTTIVILIVLAAILLCGIVFVQESKGGGLASGFAESNSLLGVRKTTDFVEKATWTLAGVMVVLSVITVFALPSNQAVAGSVLEQPAATETPAAMPGVPQTSATQQPSAEQTAPQAEQTQAPAAE
ncbi:MAG: preprotein translocase subunit SecG [Bacteroidales bacterium]|nr:preprotein translocase subunit SecG [Candidatus Physcousia equi]